jgi:Pyruvate/2-oxoacid:ferredoxin oxidoreductase delta subunit
MTAVTEGHSHFRTSGGKAAKKNLAQKTRSWRIKPKLHQESCACKQAHEWIFRPEFAIEVNQQACLIVKA